MQLIAVGALLGFLALWWKRKVTETHNADLRRPLSAIRKAVSWVMGVERVKLDDSINGNQPHWVRSTP